MLSYPPIQRPYTGRQHVIITNTLRLFWVIIVISGELGAFFWSLSGCEWPELDLGKPQSRNQEYLPSSHVLLVADPQVHHSALYSKDSAWANPVRRVIFELNLRKNWRVALRLQPDVVIFLGDMLANGKASKILSSYQQAAQKFRSIFTPPQNSKVYYIPGNNDVGLGSTSQLGHNARTYYKEVFGPFNQQFRISNHTFVGLDAPGIVDEDYTRHGKFVGFDNWKPIPNGPVAFVKEVMEDNPGNVILLSHIPLSRPETASCGPFRERGNIMRGAGPGYQRMLGKQTTNFLLKNLQPSIIFSADNRDYCDYTHILGFQKEMSESPTHAAKIREVTVKSFSMSVHIRRPGFQLLSLIDPAAASSPNTSHKDTLCLLPDQYWIYTSLYGPCLMVTIVVLFFLNFRSRIRLFGHSTHSKQQRHPLSNGLTLSLTPSPRSSGRSSPNAPILYADGKLNPWSAASSTGWSSFTPPQPSSPRFGLPSHLRIPHTPLTSRPSTPVSASPASVIGSLTGQEDRYVSLDEDDEEDTMYPSQYVTIRRGDEESWPHISSPRRLPSHYIHSHDRHSPDDVNDDFELVPSLAYNAEPGVSSARSSTSIPRPPVAQFISAPPPAPQQSPSNTTSVSSSSCTKPRRYSPIYSRTFTFALLDRRRRVQLQLPPAFLLPSSYTMSSLRNLLDLCGIHDGPNNSQQPTTLLDAMNLRRRRRGGPISALVDFLEVFWPAVVGWIIINLAIL